MSTEQNLEHAFERSPSLKHERTQNLEDLTAFGRLNRVSILSVTVARSIKGVAQTLAYN